MVISVVVIAMAAASYAFVPTFRTGVRRLGADVSDMLATGQGGRRRSATPPRNLGDYAPRPGGPFRLPNASPDSGCASGMVCLPESSSPLGAPVSVCRPGDRC